MELRWYRRDQEGVAEALEGGAHPDLATTMASGPLDDLVGLHEELGVFAALDSLDPQRMREGIDDRLGSRPEIVYPVLGWMMRLHLGSVSERSSRAAMGRKRDLVSRTPVS